MNSKFLQISEDLIKNSHDNGEISYIFKTKVHAIIVCQIFGNKKITFEDLCKNLTSVASRTTIQSILIDGVNKDYLSKEVDKKDKRKKYYNCNNLREVITKWFHRNRVIFSS